MYNTKTNHVAVARTLNRSWRQLCDQFLPVTAESTIWRYSRDSMPDDPEQGWKIHLSATILSAVRLLERVGPELSQRCALFKAPISLAELEKLNAGVFYGYSQVGKCLTIYPKTNTELISLAKRLHQLTQGVSGPTIPFDLKYRSDSNLYYRYGAFKALRNDGIDGGGERRYAVRDPTGQLVADDRESTGKPDWVNDPLFSKRKHKVAPAHETPLQTTFRAFEALAQRGKGGVYKALDFSVSPPRLCTLKEGRKNGEVTWDERDGFWRIKHEERTLSDLRAKGVDVPHVYSSFEAEQNFYLVMEFIDGENLEKCLIRRRRKLRVRTALKLSVEIAQLLVRIHSAGRVWRDCKPRNIIISKDGRLRPLDFEGACRIDEPDPLPYGTTSYLAPECDEEFRGQSRLPEDLYALGAVIYLLFVGRTPDVVLKNQKCWRNVPESVHRLVDRLLDPNPRKRPAAHVVARRLANASRDLG